MIILLNFYFLDLNPDEQVGGRLKSNVRSMYPVIQNTDNLWEALNEAYNHLKLDRQFFINLIESMPRRIKQVLDKEGGHTKY